MTAEDLMYEVHGFVILPKNRDCTHGRRMCPVCQWHDGMPVEFWMDSGANLARYAEERARGKQEKV